MMLTDQICTQAALLAGQPEPEELLKLLCQTAAGDLAHRLRPELSPEDHSAEFTAAASLLALAAWKEAGAAGDLAEFRAGDLTVKRAAGAEAVQSLRRQAWALMKPYLRDGFQFLGV